MALKKRASLTFFALENSFAVAGTSMYIHMFIKKIRDYLLLKYLVFYFLFAEKYKSLSITI